MRILLAHNRYLHRGGEDAVFESEVALLREHGHDVAVWEESNVALRSQASITVARNTVWSVGSQKKLGELIRHYRPEVVHFHNTFLRISPAAYYTCQRAGLPVVQTLHNYRLLCPAATLLREGKVCEDCLGRWGLLPSIRYGCWHDSSAQTAVVATMLTAHRWLKTWHKQVDRLIALTEFQRKKFIEAGFPAAKIAVKPNFVHPDPGLGGPGLEGRVRAYALYVGRLSPEKGLVVLLQAWKMMPALPLKIVGDGPLAEQLQALIAEYQLVNVEMLGWQSAEAILELMQSARILVMPSAWYEGFPRVIPEAYASGVPILASRLGSLAELIEDGVTGLHFEVGNAQDLAAKIAWVAEHGAEVEQMGLAARRMYERCYSAESNYAALMAIYQDVIDIHRE